MVSVAMIATMTSLNAQEWVDLFNGKNLKGLGKTGWNG